MLISGYMTEVRHCDENHPLLEIDRVNDRTHTHTKMHRIDDRHPDESSTKSIESLRTFFACKVTAKVQVRHAKQSESSESRTSGTTEATGGDLYDILEKGRASWHEGQIECSTEKQS